MDACADTSASSAAWVNTMRADVVAEKRPFLAACGSLYLKGI